MSKNEVTVKLQYALRHPDCTTTSQEDLMRMAAEYIDGLEEANTDLGEALDRCQTNGLALVDLTRELDVALNGEWAASEPSLASIVSQVKDQKWKLVRNDEK